MITDAGFLGTYLTELWACLGALCTILIARSRTRTRRIRLLGLRTEHVRRMVIAGVLASAMLGLAVSRPYWGRSEVQVPASGTDIYALVDVSLSMLADDMPPLRLAFAKRKLLDLVTLLSKRAMGDRLAIVLFSGEAYLFCPPTSDYGILRTYINSISTELIASGGSSIAEGISIAIKSLKASRTAEAADSAQPILLLLSDGEDLSFDAAEVLALLKKSRMQLSSLGIGSTHGRPIELNSGQFIRDRNGNIVLTRLEEDNLRALSAGSGGLYQRATLDDSDLEAILVAAAENMPKREHKETVTNYREYGPYLALAALAFITMCFLSGKRTLVFPATMLLFITGTGSELLAQHENARAPSRYESYQAYKRGDYELAVRGFEAALSEDPHDLKALQALGNTLFRLKRYDQARSRFNDLQQAARTGKHKFEALYNRGNAELALKDFEAAIKSYQEALKIKPKDEAATHNLALAQALLKQITPTPTPPRAQSSQSTSVSSSESASSTAADSSQSNSASLGASDSAQSEQALSSDQHSNSQQASDAASSTSVGSDNMSSAGSGSAQSAQEQSAAQSSAASPSSNQSGATEQSGNSQSSAPQELNQEVPEGQLPEHDPKALKEQEAHAWLDSLSDSPLLIYKKDRSRRHNRDQYW